LPVEGVTFTLLLLQEDDAMEAAPVGIDIVMLVAV
jgi:hypothetical protein